jgi:hypothetical protein
MARQTTRELLDYCRSKMRPTDRQPRIAAILAAAEGVAGEEADRRMRQRAMEIHGVKEDGTDIQRNSPQLVPDEGGGIEQASDDRSADGPERTAQARSDE